MLTFIIFCFTMNKIIFGSGIMKILLIVIAVIVIYAIYAYNSLVSLKNKVDNGWHQIETQLQRRYDLIPNLVETVKGYAKHERELFEKVTEARANSISAQSAAEKANAENNITSALKSIFAVAENYPDLKANQNYRELQVELTNTENKVSFARQFYNDSVTAFNTAIDVFPKNIIAGILNFKKRDYFEVEEPEARKAPKVQF